MARVRSSAGRVASGAGPGGGTGQAGAGRAWAWAGASSSQAQQAISAPTKMQYTQKTAVGPAVTVRPAALAWLGERPTCSAGLASPSWTRAEMAWAAIGIVAPASSAAPSRGGRHSAATATTATRATITSTSAAMTRPGLANALPAVIVRVAPFEVVIVNLSQDGANATAVPIAASSSMTSGPVSWARGFAGAPAAARLYPAAAPAVASSQPRSVGHIPPAGACTDSAVATSAASRPNVTTLTPRPSSAPIRCRAAPEAISSALAVQAAR